MNDISPAIATTTSAQEVEEPIRLWFGLNGGIALAEAPRPGGAVLEYMPCVPESARSVVWFPSLDQAKKALADLAEPGTAMELREDGLYLDMTIPGCHSSYARVETIPDDEIAGREDLEAERRSFEEMTARLEEHQLYDDGKEV